MYLSISCIKIFSIFTEIILTVVWIVLAICGTTFQLYRERNKAPFPPCPRHSDGYEHFRNLLRRNAEQNPSDTEPLLRGENSGQIRGNNSRGFQRNNPATNRGHNTDQSRGDNPQQPLLPDNERRGYGAMNHSGAGDVNTEENNRPRMV